MTDKTETFVREEEAVAPHEWEDDYAGVNEYSIGLWFRWIEVTRVPWSSIYSFTSNEKEIRSNA